jgi:O-antigen/teichoic acid export membrane protein
VYVYVLAWVNLLALPVTLGYATSLVRFIPSYRSDGRFALMRGLLRRATQQVTAAGVSGGALLILVTVSLGDSLTPELAATFYIAAFLLPLLALSRIRGAMLRGLRRVVIAAVPTDIIRPLMLLAVAGGFYLWGEGRLTAPWAMTANLAGAVVAFAVGTVWLLRALPGEVRREPAGYATAEWIWVSLPLLLNGALHLVMKQSDVLMLGALSSTADAGVYAATTRIGTLVLFGLTAVNSILAPMISELYTRGDMEGLRRTVTRGAWLGAAVAVPTLAALALLGVELLGLFGEGFTEGYTPLLILLVGYGANALAGSVGFLMTMTGHHLQALRILALSAGLNLALNALLIPLYGMAGAAVATAVSMVLWNGLMLAYVWRRFRINPTITAGGFR